MTLYRLTHATPEQAAELAALMDTLSDHPTFTSQTLADVLASPQSYLYVAEDEGHIVGCATLCLFHAPMGCRGSIEDVVVLPAYRGRGIARRLMQALLEEARHMAPITLQLTSRPHRTAARALYGSMGFQVKDTGYFTLRLS